MSQELKCKCGCGLRANYLCTGYDYDPAKPNGKGRQFVDEPCCLDSALYLEEGSAEYGFEFIKKPLPHTHMNTKTWEYGTRLKGEVAVVITGVEKFIPRMCVVVSDSEAFVMIWVAHQLEPVKGLAVTIEFQRGGPTGGYWQIIKPEAGQ